MISCFLIACVPFSQIGRSLTTSALTAATAVTQSVLESSSESSANATVVPIGSDKCQEQGRESRSPSVDR